MRPDAPAEDGDTVYAWVGACEAGCDKDGTEDGDGFVVELYVTIQRDAPAGPDAGPTTDAGTAICGDNTIEDQETCDDGNTDPGDGCSASCLIEEGWNCQPSEPCVSICGDGLVVGSEECDPGAASGPPCRGDCMIATGLAIVGVEMSPPLLDGFSAHFTGVTNYLLAQPSTPDADVEVTCTDVNGTCARNFRPSPVQGEPPLSEITVPFDMAPGQYTFSFTATFGNSSSDPVDEVIELQEGSGMVDCEYTSNGLPGNEEERRLGLRLQDETGVEIPVGEYQLYVRRSTGEGWQLHETYLDADKVELIGNSGFISETLNFLVLAVDRGSGTPSAYAARQFRYLEAPSGPTRGCRVCSRGANGNCRIISLE